MGYHLKSNKEADRKVAIQVSQYKQIRMLYEQEHRSIRWIARELHCSRDTVRKYIEGDTVPWERQPGSGRKSDGTLPVDLFYYTRIF